MHKQPRLLLSWDRENYIFPKVTTMGSPIEAAHTQQKLTQVTLSGFYMNLLFSSFIRLKSSLSCAKQLRTKKIVFDLPLQVLKLVLLATKKRAQRFTNFIVTRYVIYRTQPTKLFLTKRKLHRLSAGHVYFFCSSWLSSHLIFNFLLLSRSINKIWKGWPQPRDLCCVFPNAWPQAGAHGQEDSSNNMKK